jgi:predicted Zn-dependent peptidase
MSFRDQQKYLDMLKKYERNFSPEDKYGYDIFVKRNKDDEDFDTLSMKKLKDLHDKYYVPVDKSKFDALFKKKEE